MIKNFQNYRYLYEFFKFNLIDALDFVINGKLEIEFDQINQINSPTK
jgi:hypothetical protein